MDALKLALYVWDIATILRDAGTDGNLTGAFLEEERGVAILEFWTSEARDVARVACETWGLLCTDQQGNGDAPAALRVDSTLPQG